MIMRTLKFSCALAVLISSWAAYGAGPLSRIPDDRTPLFGLTSPGHPTPIGIPGDPKSKARIIRVVMTDDMRYTPNQINVSRGETVRLEAQNIGSITHELVLGTWKELEEHAELMQKFPDMEHDDPNAMSVVSGNSKFLVWKFTKPGTFYYGCLNPGHFEAGMVGKVVVR